MPIPNTTLVDGKKNGRRYVGYVVTFREFNQHMAVVMELPPEDDDSAETVLCSSQSFADRSQAEQWVYDQWQKLMGVQ